MSTTAQHPARRVSGQPRRSMFLARLAGLALVLCGLAFLFIPTSAHVDVPNVGNDVFFDCGGALYPGTRPAEEPGISACSDVNNSMLRWGLLLTVGGVATSLVAHLRIRRELSRPAP